MSKTLAFLASILVTLLIYNSASLPSFSESQQTLIVARAIDGDTLETEDGRKIRLVNINTPEKGKKGYNEAKAYLQQLEHSPVEFEFLGQDRYSRYLARAYTDEYVNEEIIKKGLGTIFLVQDSETKKFSKTQEEAIENSRGIWKKSQYYNCFKTQIDAQEEFVELTNTCAEINLDSWILKDESRKEYTFYDLELGEITIHTKKGKDSESELFWNSEQNVWNNDRDTLLLLDKNGDIAHYDSYGY